MEKVVKITVPIVIIIIAVIAISVQNSGKEICFNSNCITAEVANSPQERARGLMYRTSLEENEGMLFIFEEPAKHGFWMRNTLIPLDIIWLNERKKIIHIATAQPCMEDSCPSFVPKQNALYVIEVNAGFAEKNNIQIGDIVSIN